MEAAPGGARTERLLADQHDFCAVYDEIAEDLAAFGITNTVRYKAAPDTAFCREMRAVADVEARARMAERDGIRASNESRRARADRGQPLRRRCGGEARSAEAQAQRQRDKGDEIACACAPAASPTPTMRCAAPLAEALCRTKAQVIPCFWKTCGSGEVVRIPAPGGILGRAGRLLARPLLAEGVRRPCRGGRRQRRALDHRAHGPQRVGRGAWWRLVGSALRRAPTAVRRRDAEAGRHGVPRAGGHPGGRGGPGPPWNRTRRTLPPKLPGPCDVPCAGPNMPWKAPKVALPPARSARIRWMPGRSRASRRGAMSGR